MAMPYVICFPILPPSSSCTCHRLLHIRSLLWLLSLSALRPDLGTGVDALSFWPVDVVCWNPALVVCLSTACDSWTIGTDNADLIRWIDLLGLARGALSPLTALAATLLLGEESGVPGVINEVACTTKSTGEDKVQEDAESESVDRIENRL